MKKTVFRSPLILVVLAFCAIVGTAAWLGAQDGDNSVFRITVDMVQLNVAVTDNKGNYVTGLRPWDFAITEDGIAQKVATFGEGNEAPRRLADFDPQEPSKPEVVPSYTAKIGNKLRDKSGALFPEESMDKRLRRFPAPAFSFCLTPAITCTRASCLHRTLSLNSCGRSTTPTASRSTLIAAISR